MYRVILATIGLAVCAGALLYAFPVQAFDETTLASPRSLGVSGPTSGYEFKWPETRAVQDDDEMNPGFLWVEDGAESWETVEGAAGKACSSCHERAEASMKGVGAAYPKHHEPSGKPINLEQRINLCRTENMQAPAWAWESDELLAMTTYVRNQSHGMPVEVSIDGPARPFFEQGKALYHTRLGLLDMSCSHCHDGQAGKFLRAQLLSQGQTNGFPTYFLGFQRVISLNFMFRFCNGRVRATPYEFDSDEIIALELYTAWRGRGLPVEAPSVR
jgi:sulfur-oxidizing protein SoxA